MIPGATGRCVLHPSPPPRCGRCGQQRHGLGGPRPVNLRQRVHRGVNAALVVGVVVAVRGRRGGGREARGIPGRGEEDEYRGRKVQGGVDEAQRRREEEEGGSSGGWARDGVPGGLEDRVADAPPSRFGEGGSPPAPCRLSRTHRR